MYVTYRLYGKPAQDDETAEHLAAHDVQTAES
jgi:hypothetical protein